MAVNIQTSETYGESVRRLFTRGPYWDKQFEEAQSDCALFCKAKADMIVRLKNRMADLQNESFIKTSAELLNEWEKTLLGKINWQLEREQRRSILLAKNNDRFSRETIKETGRLYGITVTDIVFPFRPAFFGHSRFSVEPAAGPAAFSLLFMYALPADEDRKREFENAILSTVLANYNIHFIYTEARNGGNVS